VPDVEWDAWRRALNLDLDVPFLVRAARVLA